MPKEGDRIDHYMLTQRLGRGGQGTVWGAVDMRELEAGLEEMHPFLRPMPEELLERAKQKEPHCAFKFIDRPDEKALPRAREEVQAVQMLHDDRIIKIFDHKLVEPTAPDEFPWIRMEYVDGGNLKDPAEQSKWKLDIFESLKLFKDICEAVGLAHSHEKPVIHRDLKPENILLRHNGKPVVSDFGICQIQDDNRFNLTSASEVGARNYIAPELRGIPPTGKPSPASDIYSLGKVLYFMLSGGRVRDREDHEQREHDMRRWSGSTPQMQKIYEIFGKTVCEKPEDRLQTTKDLLTMVNAELVEGSKCFFCGKGLYRELTGNDKLGLWNVRNYSGSRVLDTATRLYVCDSCGNLQYLWHEKTGSENA